MTSAPASIRDIDEEAVPVGRWLPGMIALAAIWGSSFLFIKVGVSQLPPLFVSGGRVLTGTITLALILLVTRDRLPRDPMTWVHNAVVGVVGVAVPFSLFAYGEQRVPSLLAGIWNATTPLVVLPVAVWIFRTERMTARRGAGLALGFVGALVILGVWQGADGSSWTGQLMCFGAAACYGIGVPYTKRFIAHRPDSGVAMSFCQLLAATLVLAIVAPLVGPLPDPGALSWQVVASVTALGALGSGVAFVLHVRNIRLIGATSASMVTYLIPVFATVVGIAVLGESVSWHEPLGAVVVLAGVAVSQGLGRRRTVPVPADGLPEEPEPVAGAAGQDRGVGR